MDELIKQQVNLWLDQSRAQVRELLAEVAESKQHIKAMKLVKQLITTVAEAKEGKCRTLSGN